MVDGVRAGPNRPNVKTLINQAQRLPTPMASDGMKDGKGGGAGSTYPFRKILATPRASGAHHGPEIAKAMAAQSTGVSLVTQMEMGRRLATPRKTDADRGFRGDVLAQLQGQNNKHAGMQLPTPTAARYGSQSYPEDPSRKRPSLETLLSTPRASDMKAGGNGDTGRMGTVRHQLQKAQETLPTPTKRDKRLDSWSPAYDRRKSPTMDAVLDGAQTGKAPEKWVYARQIATMLSDAGLTGPSMTLPITYGWMLGYPPGWLSRALQSAVQEGLLRHPSLSKRSGTR